MINREGGIATVPVPEHMKSILEKAVNDSKKGNGFFEDIFRISRRALNILGHYRSEHILSLRLLEDICLIVPDALFVVIKRPEILSLGWKAIMAGARGRKEFLLSIIFNKTVSSSLIRVFNEDFANTLKFATGINITPLLFTHIMHYVSEMEMSDYRLFNPVAAAGRLNIQYLFKMLNNKGISFLGNDVLRQDIKDFLTTIGRAQLISAFDEHIGEIVNMMIETNKTGQLITALYEYHQKDHPEPLDRWKLGQVIFDMLHEVELGNKTQEEGVAASIVSFIKHYDIIKIDAPLDAIFITILANRDTNIQQIILALKNLAYAKVIYLNDKKRENFQNYDNAIDSFIKVLCISLNNNDLSFLSRADNVPAIQNLCVGLIASDMIPGVAKEDAQFGQFIAKVLSLQETKQLIEQANVVLCGENADQKQHNQLFILHALDLFGAIYTQCGVNSQKILIILKFLKENNIFAIDEKSSPMLGDVLSLCKPPLFVMIKNGVKNYHNNTNKSDAFDKKMIGDVTKIILEMKHALNVLSNQITEDEAKANSIVSFFKSIAVVKRSFDYFNITDALVAKLLQVMLKDGCLVEIAALMCMLDVQSFDQIAEEQPVNAATDVPEDKDCSDYEECSSSDQSYLVDSNYNEEVFHDCEDSKDCSDYEEWPSSDQSYPANSNDNEEGLRKMRLQIKLIGKIVTILSVDCNEGADSAFLDKLKKYFTICIIGELKEIDATKGITNWLSIDTISDIVAKPETLNSLFKIYENYQVRKGEMEDSQDPLHPICNGLCNVLNATLEGVCDSEIRGLLSTTAMSVVKNTCAVAAQSCNNVASKFLGALSGMLRYESQYDHPKSS